MKKRIVYITLIVIVFFSFQNKNKTTPYLFSDLSFFPPMPLPLNYQITNEGVELGRYLFYDSILSRNYNLSCGSCHNQVFSFSDSDKKFSIGSNGNITKRNAPPLFNLAWYEAFFWDGRAATIEEQVFHPVRDTNELNLDWKTATERINQSKFYRKFFTKVYGRKNIDSVLISNAISQFLRTLISNQSKFDKVLNGLDYLSKDEYEGFALVNDMTKGDCLHCHTTDENALGTTGKFSNNGLDSANKVTDYRDIGLGATTSKIADYGKFKIPSLRNLAFTSPYMHDGRFNTIEEVLDFYSEGVHNSINIDSKMSTARNKGAKLNNDEKRKIIAFLNTLNDSVFIKEKKYNNPFIKSD